MGRPTKHHWDRVKTELDQLEVYSREITRELLLKDNLYKRYKGKARNRTMIIENARLYKSVLHHTEQLRDVFETQGTYASAWNLTYRMKFIVEHNYEIEKLRCSCGKKYAWTGYCRRCPDNKKTQLGKTKSEETKKKSRVSTLKYLSHLKGQLAPRYNVNSIPIIEQYGKDHGYNFMHAENGGEYFVRELGYFLDGYDPINNVAIEVDESHHFDREGNLKEKDQIRQQQIEELLGCTFVRIRYDRG